MITFPAKRTLSTYPGETGKSVSSIEMFCLFLLSIAFADKKAEGLFIENGVVALSVN
jgi:hypothetical protein